MKNLLRSCAEEFVYGAHLVSLGASGIILSITLIFNLPTNIFLLFIAYLILQVIYRYNYFRELQFDIKSNPERVKHLSTRKRLVQALPFILIIILYTCLYFTNWATVLLATYICITGILYTEYFKKVKVLGIKNYYTGHFWAAIVLLVPFFYELPNVYPYLYIVLFIFIRGIVNTVFFDLKDIEDDRERDIRTFPVLWGKKKTLFILQIINIISFLPLLIGVLNNHIPTVGLFLSATIFLGIFYLVKGLKMDGKTLRQVSYILIDGEYMFWPLIILLGSIII